MNDLRLMIKLGSESSADSLTAATDGLTIDQGEDDGRGGSISFRR